MEQKFPEELFSDLRYMHPRAEIQRDATDLNPLICKSVSGDAGPTQWPSREGRQRSLLSRYHHEHQAREDPARTGLYDKIRVEKSLSQLLRSRSPKAYKARLLLWFRPMLTNLFIKNLVYQKCWGKRAKKLPPHDKQVSRIFLQWYLYFYRGFHSIHCWTSTGGSDTAHRLLWDATGSWSLLLPY